MAPTIPYGEPTRVTAGDAWIWRRVPFANYPLADGWVLSYAIVCRSSTTQPPLTWNPSWVEASTGEYVVTIPSSATADLVAGGWEIVGYLTLAGRRDTAVPLRPLLVDPNLATAAVGDRVLFAERMLGIVEAELQARVTGNGSAHESYAINNRQITKMPVSELRQWRASLKTEVAMARGGSGTVGRTVLFSFPSASRCTTGAPGVWE